jgi:hypothetical protein
MGDPAFPMDGFMAGTCQLLSPVTGYLPINVIDDQGFGH